MAFLTTLQSDNATWTSEYSTVQLSQLLLQKLYDLTLVILQSILRGTRLCYAKASFIFARGLWWRSLKLYPQLITWIFVAASSHCKLRH